MLVETLRSKQFLLPGARLWSETLRDWLETLPEKQEYQINRLKIGTAESDGVKMLEGSRLILFL